MCRASATTADVRGRSATISPTVYQGRVSAFYPFFPEGPLVRVHFIIGRSGGATPNPDRAELGGDGRRRSFAPGPTASPTRLRAAHEPVQARALFERYRDAFSDGYREAYPPAVAVADIRMIEALSPDRPLGVDFYRARRGRAGTASA